jgi:hypothetical protein
VEVFMEGLRLAVRREGPVPREENDADGEQNYNRGAEHHHRAPPASQTGAALPAL